MANGVSRIVLADNVNKAQSALNDSFKNSNEVAKKTKKFPSRSAKEHNHSK